MLPGQVPASERLHLRFAQLARIWQTSTHATTSSGIRLALPTTPEVIFANWREGPAPKGVEGCELRVEGENTSAA